MAIDGDGAIDGAAGGSAPGFPERGGGTVAVNGRSYAVGLIWEGVVANEGSAVEQARRSGRAQGADLFCVRKDRGQYGLGSRALGHKERMPPLAAALADAIDGSWVGIFETEGGYYFGAARDDQVLADCDRLIADRQEAVDAFSELFLGYGSSWKQAFAPADWGMEDTSPFGLDEALAGTSPSARLTTVDRTGKILRLGLLLAAMTAALVGYRMYEARLAEAEALRAAEEAARQAIGREAPPPPPPMPWEGKPQGVPTLVACADAVMAARVEAPGWKPVSLACEGGAVVLTLHRLGGTINWIGAALNREGFRPIVAPVGENAAVSWPLVEVEPHPKEIATASLREVRRYLLSQFDESFHKIEMSAGDGAPHYVGLAFSFKTAHDPKEFARILEPVPALLISRVSLDLASWTWTIEGKVYEKLPLPAPGDPRPAQ